MPTLTTRTRQKRRYRPNQLNRKLARHMRHRYGRGIAKWRVKGGKLQVLLLPDPTDLTITVTAIGVPT